MFGEDDEEMIPGPPDPYGQYEQFQGSSWQDDLAAVGFQDALPWFVEATGGLPPDYNDAFSGSMGTPPGKSLGERAIAAQEAAANEARFWRLDQAELARMQAGWMREQLVVNERMADKARAEGHWQAVEDLAFRREALIKQLEESEKNRRLQEKSANRAHQAQSAQSTGYWMGPQGTGV